MKLKRVYLEIHNLCNLHCSFCHVSKRPPRSMTLSEIERILSEIKPVCDHVYLHLKGEPLMHPELREILKRIDQFNMKAYLVSNGSLLMHYPDLLQFPCMKKISISLHSLPFQSLSTEAYLAPIFTLSKQLPSFPNLCLELRFWNRGRLDEKSKAALNKLLEISELQPTPHKDRFRWKPQVYIHFDQPFEWPAEAKADNATGFCHGARTMIGILADGTVVPCCLDDEGQIELGNLFHQPLQEILSQSRYQNLVKGFRERKLVEPLCRQCSYRHRFD